MSLIPKPIKKEVAKEVVVFNSGKRTKKETDETEPTVKKSFKNSKLDDDLKKTNKDDKNTQDNEVMSLKQAKFDVFKFGIKGFSKEEQENAKAQMAIKLGAAPPKNKCVNYKDLLNSKKEEKKKKEELLKENRLFEAKVLSSKNKLMNKKKPSMNSQRKSKINKGHVGAIKGHIGSFSNGVLKINKRDLKKLGS